MLEYAAELGNYFIKYGALGLFVLAFLESFIFPIPPDPILITLGLTNVDQALFLGMLTTVGSVFGGIFGYILGIQAGRPLLFRLFKEKQVEKVINMFAAYGGWAVFIAAFTPIPYKVFTITAGIAKVNFSTFVVASIVGRGMRFVSIGAAITLFGERALQFINKYMEITAVVISVLVLAAVYLYNYWRKSK